MICQSVSTVNAVPGICRGHTMSKDTLPATPGERGGKACFIRGFVVAEPDLEWMMIRK